MSKVKKTLPFHTGSIEARELVEACGMQYEGLQSFIIKMEPQSPVMIECEYLADENKLPNLIRKVKELICPWCGMGNQAKREAE